MAELRTEYPTHALDASLSGRWYGKVIVYDDGSCELYIEGGDHWNVYYPVSRGSMADLVRRWRRFGFEIERT